ncbi:TIGR01777 family oxidoreductase [Prescottella equi]|uniref:TIGR01777 family oxidoreductase n=1 Tax=Rhodococcus hoagii TaxID=43767 RepID=UPI001A0D62CD|nr:TIGR01777 family oxidoreductase [Prescottella equi]NKT43309.1 TIGR01777 family protein [Prescottella equi]BCN84283.1 epimerase [Prescottella equi]
MRIVVAGSSGLIGNALVTSLHADGHEVTRLVRRPPSSPDESQWDPGRGQLDAEVLRGADAVVNLCGAGIGDKRWSGAYKQELRDSRLTTTDVLAHAVAEAGVPVLLNGSAIGYYGDTGDRIVDERSPAGGGFLADLCRDWEAATARASAAGVRVVNLRTATVLSPTGGMLGKLRPLFSLGLGGRLGSGRQYLSWISLADEVAAIEFTLTHDDVRGPVDLCAPEPVTNTAFTSAMGHALHRPTPWIVPGFAVSALVGEFAREAVLTGQRAVPKALTDAGFDFRHRTIEDALGYAFGQA